MDIQEVKDKKRELEIAIFKLINEFETESGCVIHMIRPDYVLYGTGKNMTSYVHLEIRL